MKEGCLERAHIQKMPVNLEVKGKHSASKESLNLAAQGKKLLKQTII